MPVNVVLSLFLYAGHAAPVQFGSFALIAASAEPERATAGDSAVKTDPLLQRLLIVAKTDHRICQLVHPGFRLLGEPVFRLSEGQRLPSMVVQIDNHEAVLPLRSVAHEFKIDPESADGQMLVLIEQALEFVVVLHLGENLPSELDTGEASWKPTLRDRQLAASRLWHELVRGMMARSGQTAAITSIVPGWENHPGNRKQVDAAIEGAISQLGGVDAAEVTARIEKIGEELAYIETMRRTLTRGMAEPRDKLFPEVSDHVPLVRRDMLHQVQTLAQRGMDEITRKLDEADARLDDILAMMRDLDAAITWLREQRDRLFRINRAWEPVFEDWGSMSGRLDDFFWKAVERTYAFLAPQFMSFQEWTVIGSRPKQAGLRAKVW